MIACSQCGFEASDESVLCPRCAAPLVALPPIAEERKTVTVLFCDLVGFTEMGEAADPEDVAAVLSDYCARATKVIEHHGGVVEKFIGDAVVGVFGVPVVHEDDAERAVRAGLRILESLEGLERPDGTPLEARVGVNTGEALVRRDVDPASGRGFLTGDTVNTAARLEVSAPPGGLAAGPLTRELTASAIIYEELPEVAAKGKAKPLRAWLAIRPAARTGLRTSGLSMTPFLGREEELASLDAALQDAARMNECRFVLVVGEPGIGKSRLVLEFAQSLEASRTVVTWRQGRCLPYGEGVAFWALGEIVKAQAGILDSDAAATVEAKLEALLRDEEDAPWLIQRVRPLLGLEAAKSDREQNFAAWRRLIELIAAPRPTVLVFEDLHWAGGGMLAFVEHLLSGRLGVPLLVVATTRPELLERRTGPLTAGSDRLCRLSLPALPDETAQALITELLRGELAADVKPRIVDLVGGNPLYAEQYARLLLDGDRLTLAPDGLRLAGDEPLPLPTTIQAVVSARLDTLPPEHKALLSDAAVMGETFWRGGVAALSGRSDTEVSEAMASLAERDLVRPVVMPSIEGEPEYLFWHALVRDVAYGELPRAMRAKKHEAAARWIEERAGERGDEFAEILAHHYETAMSLARALRDDERAASLLGPAIDSLTRAGKRGVRLDVEAAIRYFGRALELAEPSSPDRLRILPEWSQALYLRNRFREAAGALREAIAAFRASGQIRSAATSLCLLANTLPWLGEPGLGLTTEAVNMLAGDGPSAEKAEVLGLHALALTLEDCEPRLIREVADEAVEICGRLGLPDPAIALSCRASARLDMGDLVGGLEDFDRARTAARAQGLGIERATIDVNYASTMVMVQGPRAEYAAFHEALEFTRAHGLEAYVITARGGIADSLRTWGRWDEALAEVGDLIPVFEAREDLWDLLYMRSFEAQLLAWRGRAQEAMVWAPWIVERGRVNEVSWTKAYALLAAAAVHLGMGEAEAAAGLLEECCSMPRGVWSVVEVVPDAVRMALACGEVELAGRMRWKEKSEEPAPRLPLERWISASVRGLLCEAHGDHEAAAAGFADAAAGWRVFEEPYEEAHALFGQGRCLVALGRAPEAAAPLSRAREIFERLDARPALAETEALIAVL